MNEKDLRFHIRGEIGSLILNKDYNIMLDPDKLINYVTGSLNISDIYKHSPTVRNFVNQEIKNILSTRLSVLKKAEEIDNWCIEFNKDTI